MAKLIKIPTPDGKEIEGEEVEFKPIEEPWCVYQLADGFQIRMKLIVTQVIKTKNVDAEGNPQYLVKSTNALAVSPKETFRRGEVQ